MKFTCAEDLLGKRYLTVDRIFAEMMAKRPNRQTQFMR